MKILIKHAINPVCVFRSLKVALVVGTILALINHYDAIISGGMTSTRIWKIVLTYFVPFFVSMYGSASHARHMELQNCKD